MKDYYNILGIRKNASQDEIKRAYRNLAQKFHPDKNENKNFSEIFKDINEAKQVLLNDVKKKDYDLHFVDERPRPFFIRLKEFPGHLQVFKRSPSEKAFIKRRTGKEVILLSALSVLMVGAVFFFFKVEENESSPKLTHLQESNGEVGAIPERNIKQEAKAKEANNTGDQKQLESNAVKETLLPESQTENPKDDGIPNRISNEKAVAKSAEPKPEETKPLASNKEVAATTGGSKVIAKEDKPAPVLNKLSKATAGTIAKTESVSQPKAKEATLAKTEERPVSHVQKLFTSADMKDIMDKIKHEKDRSNNTAQCVQIRKTATSNVENGFALASFLRANGFIISGRETVSGTVKNVDIDAANGCVKVTIGTF